jgi:hypothetical protein
MKNHFLAAVTWMLLAPHAHAGLAADDASGACAADCGEEREPFLKAAALVNPVLLSGPDYKVVPEVQVRGYMANFLIDTPYGPLHADSVELLSVRIAEMPALATLDRASHSGAFASALAERGRKTGSALLNVVAHPIDSITGIPAGVARYLRKQVDTWSRRAQSLADHTARHAENRGDPYRAPDGPMTAGRDVERERGDLHAPPEKNHAWYARVGSETGREARRYLKYGQARRELAKRLGIDPNTSNPILNERLDELAWAAVGGNFSAGEALGAITGTAADIVSGTGQINEYVLQQTPEQLRDKLQQRLRERCSDDDTIRSFLHRGGFNDTLRTELTAALEQLAPREGCNELLELASTTHGEVEARYLVDALKLIRTRAAAGGGRLLVAGAAIAWQGDDDRILLPLPVDYLSWSHDIDDFFDQRPFAVVNKTVLIGGDASTLAQRELTERGWNLALHAPYEGAPAYARLAAATPAACACASSGVAR